MIRRIAHPLRSCAATEYAESALAPLALAKFPIGVRPRLDARPRGPGSDPDRLAVAGGLVEGADGLHGSTRLGERDARRAAVERRGLHVRDFTRERRLRIERQRLG